MVMEDTMDIKLQKDKRDARPVTRLSTGIEGLDDVLNGGLPAARLYLVEGTPGTGKTTLGMQFLMEGRKAGESGLYITLSETKNELLGVAETHGWTLDGIHIFELFSEDEFSAGAEQSVLYPAEVELGEAVQHVIEMIETLAPSRVVFDSLSEMRLLAQSALRYRRQILALKQYLSTRDCTVLCLDDKTAEPGDLQLHSIAHGVISLDQWTQDFGPERRRLRVVKLRGVKFRGGYHDCLLDRGGLRVFPRLVASEHHAAFESVPQTLGVPELDALLGGGLVPGTNTLFTGPSGVGKTTTAIRAALSALARGQRVAYYLFDEGIGTLVVRCASLGMDINPYLQDGSLMLYQIDPAELSPGEFSSRVRKAVEEDGAAFFVIDSLNAYLHAMPGERFLLLQFHELLSYLNQKGRTTILVLGQHGLIGEGRTDVDLSYLSDSILMFRFFESKGEIHGAVSALKSRTTQHLHTIHEFRITPTGLQVGEALRGLEGVLSGLPSYRGDLPAIQALAANLETQ
jgi:circadian clock protein KaiC